LTWADIVSFAFGLSRLKALPEFPLGLDRARQAQDALSIRGQGRIKQAVTAKNENKPRGLTKRPLIEGG